MSRNIISSVVRHNGVIVLCVHVFRQMYGELYLHGQMEKTVVELLKKLSDFPAQRCELPLGLALISGTLVVVVLVVVVVKKGVAVTG
ncbi:hypothetical protein EYF80_026224 [Liparis tanakae]|uniref:Uncharacterized protein n=1 Tax=Liparis tanakae TaxID=230148 RepID=A0A4Z2HFJ3_9TELE|nr:hypothetical protein EYF80_026224 [Liparis tanakae]